MGGFRVIVKITLCVSRKSGAPRMSCSHISGSAEALSKLSEEREICFHFRQVQSAMRCRKEIEIRGQTSFIVARRLPKVIHRKMLR